MHRKCVENFRDFQDIRRDFIQKFKSKPCLGPLNSFSKAWKLAYNTFYLCVLSWTLKVKRKYKKIILVPLTFLILSACFPFIIRYYMVTLETQTRWRTNLNRTWTSKSGNMRPPQLHPKFCSLVMNKFSLSHFVTKRKLKLFRGRPLL